MERRLNDGPATALRRSQDFVIGGYPRAAVGSLGRLRCLLGCQLIPGGSWFAINEGALRAGPFAAAGSPRETGDAVALSPAARNVSRGESSGSWVQIPGPVCFHIAMLFGFMSFVSW